MPRVASPESVQTLAAQNLPKNFLCKLNIQELQIVDGNKEGIDQIALLCRLI